MLNHKLRIFILTFTGTILLFILPVVAFNFVVDPFSMFHVLEIRGFNELKPEFFTHLRMAKAHAVRLLRPKGIILGSSRVEYGLDPDHNGWDTDTSPHYNLGLSGVKIYECLGYLRHAHAVAGVKKVVIGLDFFMFDDSIKSPQDFDEARLAILGKGLISAGWIHDIVVALTSFDSIMKSFKTIYSQDRQDLMIYYPNGMRDDRLAWQRIKNKGGHRKVDMKFGKLKKVDQVEGNMTLSMVYFKQLIDFVRYHDIELNMFISPVHARYLERLHKRGRWEEYEEWKRTLVKVLTSEAAGKPDWKPYLLWDFSGYNSITTEKFPSLDDPETQMQYFWESSHYKKKTGDLILDRIFSYREKGQVVPEDFGILLTSNNIEACLSRIRMERRKYIRTHWDDISDIWGESSGNLGQ